MLVLIKGAGDLASGVAVRLRRSGVHVVMTDIAQPTAVRREVSFCECMYEGTKRVEDVEGVLVDAALNGYETRVREVAESGAVAVVADPGAQIARRIPFDAVVDGIMAKRNTGTGISDAPVVLALGPGFTAGVDCHGVVETKRGHTLGRLLVAGSALPNTGVPGSIGGFTKERLLRAPADGVFEPEARIGQMVRTGDVLARVGGRPMRAQIDGVLRGLLHEGVRVHEGMKAGDVDPRCEVEDCFTVSDKSLAVAGGVLEGLLAFRKRMQGGGAA